MKNSSQSIFCTHEGHSEIIDTPPPLGVRKWKISSSIWDSIILRCSLRGLNHFLYRPHRDRKKGENSQNVIRKD